MNFSEVATLAEEIVLLGRMVAKLGFSKKERPFELSRSEIEMCRVISVLSRELKRERIPISLVFKVIPALEASVSRTMGSLEGKEYIGKIYSKEKGEKKGRMSLFLTAKGKRASDSISSYFRTKIVEMLKELLEPRFPILGVNKSTLSGGEKVLKELRQALVDNILKAYKRPELSN
jgi:hypothetical protein